MAIVKPTPKPSAEGSVLGQFSTSAGAGAAGGAYVYMGSERVMTYGGQKTGEGRGAPKYSTKPKWVSEEAAMAQFYNWPEKQRRELLHKLIVGGILPYGAGALEAETEWKKLVQASARYGQAGQQVGPMDLLTSYVAAAGGVEKGAWKQQGNWEVNVVTGAKRYAGPGVWIGGGQAQQTDTRTDLTDPDTAKAIATKLFQDMMGRDPGAGELGAFGKALATAEAANPVTQSTTTTYNMDTGQPISQDTQSSGGMTAEARAYLGEQQIKKKKEYGVNQAATTYMGAMENLVFGSPE